MNLNHELKFMGHNCDEIEDHRSYSTKYVRTLQKKSYLKGNPNVIYSKLILPNNIILKLKLLKIFKTNFEFN